MRTRGIKKQLWLSREEDKTLKNKAKKVGVSEAVLVRNLIMGFEPREKPDDRFYDVMKQLHGIGNSLNQLARKAHSLNFIDAPYYKKEAERFNKFILQVKKEYLVPKNDEDWKELLWLQPEYGKYLND